MKRSLFVVFALAIAFSAARVNPQGMPPTLVETGVVSSREFHNEITLVGRTAAIANSEIVAEVSGRVTRIEAREGTPLRRGEVMVSIDPDRIQFALEAKRAQVAQAKASAELAKKELDRAKELHSEDLVAEGGLDRAIAEHTRALEQFNQFEAELKQLELDRRNCSIRAPFDGFAGRQLVDVGEWVSPGVPVFEIVDLKTMKVYVDLPERYFGHLTVGTTVSIVVSGERDRTVEGTVTGIAPSAVQETHTFPVIITVENKNATLGGGMLVRATLRLDEVFTSMAVSKDAIVRNGNQTMIYTIADGKAAPIPVRTTATAGQMVAIEGDGLTEGMVVVVRGNERIFPGSPVRTADGMESQGGEADGTGAEAAGGSDS